MTLPYHHKKPVPIYGGDSKTFGGWTFKSNGAPVSLEGWTFQAQWRQGTNSEAFLPLVVEVADPSSGRLIVRAIPEVTEAMGGPGVWDVEGVKDGQVVTWVDGTTTYRQGVTR